ncbi:hypothetical protein OUZ56_031813 [Daphnia magna]|uniref:Uncharacterized protein n=1 Tax=Daphnia magna TaxID=35525 RepID=A0ABQ9ZV96_9CRUS|nr:hypothetical protein OUZ56_031813 [Daphnia magna]
MKREGCYLSFIYNVRCNDKKDSAPNKPQETVYGWGEFDIRRDGTRLLYGKERNEREKLLAQPTELIPSLILIIIMDHRYSGRWLLVAIERSNAWHIIQIFVVFKSYANVRT